MDSIIWCFKHSHAVRYLQPLITWRTFSLWCIYVFGNTMESSAIRLFIARLFYWALSTPNPNAIYKAEKMSSLASGIPNLSQTLSEFVRKPCEFHAHPSSEFDVQCPNDLGRSLTNSWLVAPATRALVLYFFKQDIARRIDLLHLADYERA